MVKLSSFLLVTLVLSFDAVFAQSGERETVTQSIQWFAITSNVKMTKHLTLVVEGQFRQADDFYRSSGVRIYLELQIRQTTGSI